MRTAILTALALVAFAANSVLCRLALLGDAIDPGSFTVIRLVSGAVTLLLLIGLTARNGPGRQGSWPAALMLFAYAVTFSFAYVTLDTGTGALILFGSVQLTIVVMSLLAGSRLSVLEWTGIGIAFAGLATLLLPGATAPAPTGFVLMTAAGIAWGAYTLLGRGSTRPLADTGWNFVRSLPFVAVLLALSIPDASLTWRGAFLAILSGAVASGIGYSIWYRALRGLSAAQSGVVQLLVPVLAAFGGIVFAGESLTIRVTIAAVMILGGILAVYLGRDRPVGAR